MWGVQKWDWQLGVGDGHVFNWGFDGGVDQLFVLRVNGDLGVDLVAWVADVEVHGVNVPVVVSFKGLEGFVGEVFHWGWEVGVAGEQIVFQQLLLVFKALLVFDFGWLAFLLFASLAAGVPLV